MCCLFVGWQSEFGGFTCYIANEEDEEVSVNIYDLILFVTGFISVDVF